IANAAEPRAVTDFQASALRHLAETDPAFPSPRIRPTRGGETSVAIEDAQGRAHRLRVMSWLDGAMMADGNPGSLAASMGRCLARLDSALADFAHPGDTYTLPWDISNAQLAAAKAGMIDDASLRRVCERHFEHFKSAIAPSLGELRRQVIHNDFNPGNVLVDPTDHERIVGIIDFGDMLRAPLVVDVATAATYLAIGHPDPRSEIDRFLSTYEQSIPLTEQELALIDDLIVTRLVVSVTIGHWRARQFPDNRRYIMVTQKRTIALLRQMTGE
ncbi:MAG: phosphotransferase, partial [Woeseiaceae bacterium]|nr:phosphotransferase [Woeseiaceae bacterium]